VSSGPPVQAGEAENTSTTSGAPTALILAGIGVLIVALGVLLLLRRRHLNKRPVFAGDAKPAGDPEPAQPAEAAEAAAEIKPETGDPGREPNPGPETDPGPEPSPGPQTKP
jgi:hypothetical protein